MLAVRENKRQAQQNEDIEGADHGKGRCYSGNNQQLNHAERECCRVEEWRKIGSV